MTTKDIKLIDDLLTEVTNSIAVGEIHEMGKEEYYREVLRRFNLLHKDNTHKNNKKQQFMTVNEISEILKLYSEISGSFESRNKTDDEIYEEVAKRFNANNNIFSIKKWEDLFEKKFYTLSNGQIREWSVWKVNLCNYNRDEYNNLGVPHDYVDIEWELKCGNETLTVNGNMIGKTIFPSIEDLIAYLKEHMKTK